MTQAGRLTPMPGFDPRPVWARFVLDRVALYEYFDCPLSYHSTNAADWLVRVTLRQRDVAVDSVVKCPVCRDRWDTVSVFRLLQPFYIRPLPRTVLRPSNEVSRSTPPCLCSVFPSVHCCYLAALVSQMLVVFASGTRFGLVVTDSRGLRRGEVIAVGWKG